jgi:hypothetical protein
LIYTGTGGAVYIGGSVDLELCELTDNHCSLSGAGLYADFGSTVNITDCNFTHNNAEQSGAAVFGFGSNQTLTLINTQFVNNTAACCYTSGYGSKLHNDATATCIDADTGENRGDCCYNGQYSDGTRCIACIAGADCSTVGSTLATLPLTAGFWRASDATTDVRECWLAAACVGTVHNASAATTAVSTSRRRRTTGSILAASQFDGNTYCAKGYKGPCE